VPVRALWVLLQGWRDSDGWVEGHRLWARVEYATVDEVDVVDLAGWMDEG
jgi:hypothetical protein